MFFGYLKSNLIVFFLDISWMSSFIMVLALYLNVFFFLYQKFLFVFFHYLSNQFLFFNLSASLWFLINLY